MSLADWIAWGSIILSRAVFGDPDFQGYLTIGDIKLGILSQNGRTYKVFESVKQSPSDELVEFRDGMQSIVFSVPLEIKEFDQEFLAAVNIQSKSSNIASSPKDPLMQTLYEEFAKVSIEDKNKLQQMLKRLYIVFMRDVRSGNSK